MYHKIKNRILKNLSLKIVSLILSYGLWACFASNQVMRISYAVSVCFYNLEKTCSINAPEEIVLTLSGKRSLLKFLSADACAVHIDAQQLSSGTQQLILQKDNLFLPEEIKLIDYSPSPLIVTLEMQNEIC